MMDMAEHQVGTGPKNIERVAITVWGRRISPVFDASQTLLIAELAGDSCIDFRRFTLEPEKTDEVIRLLRSCGARVLICGAISQEPAGKIEKSGIRLIPFMSGKTDEVLSWYAGDRSLAGYTMPGCRGAGRGHCRCRGGGMFDGCTPVKNSNNR